MRSMRSSFPGGRRRLAAMVVLSVGLLMAPMRSAGGVAAWHVTTVDDGGAVNAGQYSSLELDGTGLPVVSYYLAFDAANPSTTGDLRLARCTDAACTPATVSIQTVDSSGIVGEFSSLALDSAGNPVISYQNGSNDLKLAHCNDATCAGGDESLQVLDSAGSVGQYNSLVLDSGGNPVISYYDATNGDLKLLHCNDTNCTGGDESIQTVDSAGVVGQHTALALDAAGNPVISYYEPIDATNPDATGNLKLVHCNDANCAGGNESIQTIDSTGNVGQFTALVLDGGGLPVVSYYDVSKTNLKLARCSDANCTPGNVSTQTVDSIGTNGSYSSLALDAAGNPVISYRDATPANLDLKLARCSDAACTPGHVSIQTVDGSGDVGQYTSLALDGGGLPAISYYDVTNGDLKLARSVDDPAPSVTVEQAAGQADPASGSPVHFTVSFSEAVTGFGSEAVMLSGTAGATTATVTEPAPHDGTTYDVAVSGMTSSGTVVVSVPAEAVVDSGGNGNEASTSVDNTVTWNVPANAPVASDQTVTTTANLPIAIVLTGSDVDGDSLVYTVVSGPQHGSLQGSAPALTYMPERGYVGDDQVSFQVSDGQGSSNIGVVTIRVLPGLVEVPETKLHLPLVMR